MTTLRAAAAVALDENAREFISAFTSNVATLAGRGPYRSATTTGVQTLLLAAIAPSDGGSLTKPILPMPTLYPKPLSVKDVADVAAYVESL